MDIPRSLVQQGHPDYESARGLAGKLYSAVGGEQSFVQEFPELLRQAIDDVIETPRTSRLTVHELGEVERAYLAARVEILFRDFVDAHSARTDSECGETEVAVGFALERGWTLRAPRSQTLVLIGADEERAKCCVGILRVRPEYLTKGRPNNELLEVSAEGLRHVYWLMHNHPYPPNFWLAIESSQVRSINQPRCSPSERLRRLFSTVLRTPISRKVVSDVARQLDPMKRLRKNGGARDALDKDGIALLSGRRHRHIIERLGLLSCGPNEFISMRIESASDRKILAEAGYFD